MFRGIQLRWIELECHVHVSCMQPLLCLWPLIKKNYVRFDAASNIVTFHRGISPYEMRNNSHAMEVFTKRRIGITMELLFIFSGFFPSSPYQRGSSLEQPTLPEAEATTQQAKLAFFWGSEYCFGGVFSSRKGKGRWWIVLVRATPAKSIRTRLTLGGCIVNSKKKIRHQRQKEKTKQRSSSRDVKASSWDWRPSSNGGLLHIFTQFVSLSKMLTAFLRAEAFLTRRLANRKEKWRNYLAHPRLDPVTLKKRRIIKIPKYFWGKIWYLVMPRSINARLTVQCRTSLCLKWLWVQSWPFL